MSDIKYWCNNDYTRCEELINKCDDLDYVDECPNICNRCTDESLKDKCENSWMKEGTKSGICQWFPNHQNPSGQSEYLCAWQRAIGEDFKYCTISDDPSFDAPQYSNKQSCETNCGVSCDRSTNTCKTGIVGASPKNIFKNSELCEKNCVSTIEGIVNWFKGLAWYYWIAIFLGGAFFIKLL